MNPETAILVQWCETLYCVHVWSGEMLVASTDKNIILPLYSQPRPPYQHHVGESSSVEDWNSRLKVQSFLNHKTKRQITEVTSDDFEVNSRFEFWVVGVMITAVSMSGIVGNIICIFIIQYKRLNINHTFASLLKWLAVIYSVLLVSMIYSQLFSFLC